jgi:hypothetical protein
MGLLLFLVWKYDLSAHMTVYNTAATDQYSQVYREDLFYFYIVTVVNRNIFREQLWGTW